MNQRLLHDLGRSVRLSIVNRLKRSEGMSVNELARDLGMSYMGIKQHCVSMAEDGYLDTWRRPKPVGRPEMLYRLTRRAHELFPSASNATTLELLKAVETLHGKNAPGKLLFQLFASRRAAYAAKLRGETPSEKARWLARLRDAQGYMSDFHPASETEPPRIVEQHSPDLDLFTAWPICARLEAEMFSALLGAPVQRETRTEGGLYRCEFRLPAAHAPQSGASVAPLTPGPADRTPHALSPTATAPPHKSTPSPRA